MFHAYRKDSSYLRGAIFASYNEMCAYCGRQIQQRDMHIDHIVAQHMESTDDRDVLQYLLELEQESFVVDSIENYLPSCPACNLSKSNRVFTAANLRFYHEKARRHVDDILNRIEKIKSHHDEVFYEPIDPATWETLDFSYQRDISHAIMGYRLTPADVEACPQFPQVERMINRLSIVDHVVLQGHTGCGKSISVYQTAYIYYKQGWKVYRYKITDNLSVPQISKNTEQSLYIVDDAQLLSKKAMDMLADQARPNRKIIFAKTVSDTVQADTVFLTNSDAVNILYQDFMKRKDEILPIVHQCDDRIGVNFADSPIEWRLENAKKASTPWQFTYTLRGGWQTIKEQYQTIASHHNCGMLAAIIAAFQIMQLDNAVDYTWLCAWVRKIDNSLSWTTEDLRYLINQKIVLSEDDVRIVHLESANSIISQHFENSNWDNDKLYTIIERALLEDRTTPLGLVWLCNGMRGYAWYRVNSWIISEKMIAYALGNLENITSAINRMGIAYFMEKVFTMDYEKNGHWYFCQNKQIILDWIEHASTDNAYAYSRLINTLYNTDHTEHKNFVACINWEQLFSSLDDEIEPNLYSWGQLVNRLTAFFSRRKQIPFSDRLHATIDKLILKANTKNIGGLSDFFSQILFLSPSYVHDAVRKLIPVYREFFQKDMLRATEIFDLHFGSYICGMDSLLGHHPTKEQKETAKMLIEAIPENEFAVAMSTGYPRDWDRIFDIMCLIEKYDKNKAKQIVSLVDRKKLAEIAKDTWHEPHDIVRICSALAVGDIKIARSFIEDNRERITEVYSPLILIAPKCTVELFQQNTPVDLMTGHWWYYSYYALKELINQDASVTKVILSHNLSTIADRLNDISTFYMETNHCLKFVQLLHEFDYPSFNKLIDLIDLTKLKSSWEKSYSGSFKKRIVKKRYDQLLALLEK